MLSTLKVAAITATLSSVALVIYAIMTSAYTNVLFWLVYFAVVGLDLIIINYLKKQTPQ